MKQEQLKIAQKLWANVEKRSLLFPDMENLILSEPKESYRSRVVEPN